MSIMQEYQAIKKTVGKEKFDNIEKFLEEHPQYLLSDVYYKQAVYNEFEKWLLEKELNTSYKDCIKSKWSPSTAGYYAGQMKIVKMLGYDIVTNKGELKLVKKGDTEC